MKGSDGASSRDVEKHGSRSSAASEADVDVDYKARFPNVDEKKVLRKIDFRVVPVLCVLYLLAFLDRCVRPSTPVQQ